MTLRLPPSSEPPEDRPHQQFGRKVDPCPLCPHDWHGLTCRYGSCMCSTSIPRTHGNRTVAIEDIDDE